MRSVAWGNLPPEQGTRTLSRAARLAFSVSTPLGSWKRSILKPRGSGLALIKPRGHIALKET
jgi:hypothetical protein